MNNNNYKTTSEENFIKNTKKRKTCASKKKKMSPVAKGFAIAGISIGSILGIIIAIVLGAVIYFFSKPLLLDNERGANNTYVDAGGNVVERATDDSNGENGDNTKKYYTFLATATDKAGNLTDVIMIAKLTYNESDPLVSILQIPRDTYVKISSSKLYFDSDGELSKENFSGPNAKTSIKINEAFYRGKNLAYDTITDLLADVDGKSTSEITAICSDYKYKFLHVDISKVKKYANGSKEEKKEMENAIRRDFGIFYLEQLIFYNFRIPVDYYAQVNINGFKGIVDAIGGVDLTVPRRMYYNDPYQDLYIDLQPGYQHLDGDKAEQFVRFRGYVGGDIDRLDAQKIFMDAFISKLMSPETISKITPIMEQINQNLYTSVTFDNLITLSKFIIKMDLSTDIKMHTIPGAGQYINGVSYYLVDKNASWKLINDEFNVYTSDILIEDMLITDHGNIYVPVSNPGANLEFVPEEDTPDDNSDVSEKDESTEVSDETSEEDTPDDNSEVSEKDESTEVSDETSEEDSTDESDETVADDSTDISNDETDVSDESNESDTPVNSDETNTNETSDKTDEIITDNTEEQNGETQENNNHEEDDTTSESNDDVTDSSSDSADSGITESDNNNYNNESSIENDDNYALLEQMGDAA